MNDYSQNVSNLQENDDYKCDKCKDRLFILNADDEAKECECRNLRIAEDKLKASGVSDEFRKMRFENYDFKISKDIMAAFKIAKSYSKDFEEIRAARKNSILLNGQVGSGKTHLGMAVANTMLDNLTGVIYMPYRSSITNLKQSITDQESYQREIELYKNAQVLFIDDLFKGEVTRSDIRIIYEIIDYRYLKSLPVIVTTEKYVDELLEVDEAIGSRIYEMSKNYVVTMQRDKRKNYRVYGA